MKSSRVQRIAQRIRALHDLRIATAGLKDYVVDNHPYLLTQLDPLYSEETYPLICTVVGDSEREYIKELGKFDPSAQSYADDVLVAMMAEDRRWDGIVELRNKVGLEARVGVVIRIVPKPSYPIKSEPEEKKIFQFTDYDLIFLNHISRLR